MPRHTQSMGMSYVFHVTQAAPRPRQPNLFDCTSHAHYAFTCSTIAMATPSKTPDSIHILICPHAAPSS